MDLTEDQLKLYDRQRFIGIDVQKRLVNSQVLVYPLNSTITELCKNLILAGINVVLYNGDNSQQKVQQHDLESNFMFQVDDVSKNKLSTLQHNLQEMNKLAKVSVLETLDQLFIDGQQNIDCQQQISLIAISSVDIEQIEFWQNLSNRLSVPFYLLNSQGFYGYAFNDLSSGKEKEAGFKARLERIKKTKIQQKFYLYQGIQTFFGLKDLQNDQDAQRLFLEFLNRSLNRTEYSEKEEEQFKKYIVDFIDNYDIEYFPVYSVVASCISQEIIKVIGKKQKAESNWFLYDSQLQLGQFYQI